MLNCKITFKGREFANAEEFSDYIRSSPLTAIFDDKTNLGKIIAEKYSVNAEDSLAELFTRLKAMKEGVNLANVTQDDIDKYLYPEGQATDYVTQSKIHANTYAGVKATGISANFSKMLAYLFSATPIVELVDEKGKTYNVDWEDEADGGGRATVKALYSQNGVNSIQELLKRKPNFKISKRANPSVKSRNAMIFNAKKFSELVRNELNYDGTEKTMFSNVAGRELKINIFETIDTIINLAIDNVKEQKLFILGLTNSNANSLLTAIAFGIPLNDVARLFNTSVIVEESKARRLDSGKLISKAHKILETLSDDKIKNYLIETKQTSLFSEVKITAASTRGSYASALSGMLEKLGVDSDVLDDVYVGRSLHEGMSNVASLASLAKLVDMGNETFNYAQLFSLLRGLPGKKWQMDNIANLPMKYVDFKQVDAIEEATRAQTLQQIEDLYVESEEYKTAPDKDVALKAFRKEILSDQSIYAQELKRRNRTWFQNRLSRDAIVKSMTPSAASAFNNVTVLSIPHVYSAWRAVNKLSRLVEQTFALHSPRVSLLAKNITSAIKSPLAYVKGDFQELVQNNFIKFLTSNLQIEVAGVVHDMSVPEDFTYSVGGYSLRGAEAWTQDFIAELAPLTSRKDNELLQSIEIGLEKGDFNTKRLLITSDKIGDDELIGQLQRDFLRLDAIQPGLQMKLFKYAVLTSGLYYGRTNFSLIFPVDYAMAFDKALNARLDTVLTTSNIKTDINLRIIEDQFLYQFVRNNPGSLSYVNKIKPDVTAYQELGNDRTRQIKHGVDKREWGEVYFDLRYEKRGDVYYDNIIRTFGSTTYIKLDVPEEEKDYVYYRVFTTPTTDTVFGFDDSDLDVGFNIDKLKAPELPVVTDFHYGAGNSIVLNTSEQDYIKGQTIFLNPGTTKLTKLEAYRVTEAISEMDGRFTKKIIYKIQRLEGEDIDLSHKQLVQQLKDRPYYAEVSSNSKYAEVAISQEQALSKAKKKTGSLAIVAAGSLDTAGAYVLNLTGTTEDLIAEINRIPNAKRYIVNKNIVDVIVRNSPKDGVLVASALYAATGYSHPILSQNEEEAEIDAKLDAIFRIRDFTSGSTTMDNYKDGVIPISAFEKDAHKVKPNTLVYLGETKGKRVFGHVVNVIEIGKVKSATVNLLDSAVFDVLDKSTYTAEELEKINDKINPCLSAQ